VKANQLPTGIRPRQPGRPVNLQNAGEETRDQDDYPLGYDSPLPYFPTDWLIMRLRDRSSAYWGAAIGCVPGEQFATAALKQLSRYTHSCLDMFVPAHPVRWRGDYHSALRCLEFIRNVKLKTARPRFRVTTGNGLASQALRIPCDAGRGQSFSAPSLPAMLWIKSRFLFGLELIAQSRLEALCRWHCGGARR